VIPEARRRQERARPTTVEQCIEGAVISGTCAGPAPAAGCQPAYQCVNGTWRGLIAQ
jgi:hypothetical protein